MSIGRPMEFDPDVALEQAMQVFWSQGYENTSLQNLLVATGLSKSSLYQVYESKKSLFDRCVDRYLDKMADDLLAHLDSCTTGRVFIEDTFRTLAGEAGSPSAKKGCLLWNTALEFGQRDREVARQVQKGIERFANVFAGAVRRAQFEGDVDASKDAKALGYYLMSSMGGIRSMLKGGIGSTNVRDVVNMVLSSLD